MAKSKNNPNKANQWKPDPRQSLFLSYYLDPKSETFSNGLQSALRAGYEQRYAEVLVAHMPTWLSEKVKDSKMLDRAERNLDDFLEMDTVNKGLTKDGKTVYEFDDAQLKRIKADISKFVAERLGKIKWASRNELTGPEGKPLTISQILDKLENGEKQ